MKILIKRLLREGLENNQIGYKVMKYENGQLVSGANSRLAFPAKVGTILDMPGNGIYMSPNKDYVLDYYSGLAENEVLVTFEFNPNEITFGNLADKEPEIAVNKAKIVNLEELNN